MTLGRLQSLNNLARTGLSRVASTVAKPGRKVGYIGWVGHANLGDEAMADAAAHLLGQRPEILSTPRVEQMLAAVRLGGKARHRRAFVGGGTLINGGYIDLVERCLDAGVAMATLGTGVGSPGFSAGESAFDSRWTAALNRFDRVGVRGPRSLAKLHDNGVTRAEVTGDLALALTPDAPLASPDARTILFNTSPGQTAQDIANLAAFDRAAAQLLSELVADGWKVMPLAFHADDHPPIAAVLAAAGMGGAPIYQPRNFDGYAALARHASASLSVRLHGSVLASMCGLANLLVEYRGKCRDFAESVGMEPSLVALDGFSADAMQAQFAALLADRPDRGRELHAACLRYRTGLERYVADLM